VDNKILITFGSKHGGTAEISERIAQTIQENGLSVDVSPANQAVDVQQYDTIIVGTCVYIGRWHKAVVKFLEAHEQTLTGKDVWMFCSGPTGKGDPEALLKGWKYPPKLKPVLDNIQPGEIKVFHGVLNEEKLSGLERWMIKKVNAPTGDFRDWNAIASWAKSILKKNES